MPPPNTTIFTAAEIEKMRLYVTEHDKIASVVTFDLNNPPKVQYVHQEYPTVLYNADPAGHPQHKLVGDAEELRDALAAGWLKAPAAPSEAEPRELDAGAAAEVAALDEKIAAARKKKADGR